MPSLPDGTPPTPNLNSDTEHVRREFYDLVVAMQFAPLEDAEAGPEDYTGPTYTPDECGLKVFYILSRWFATWTNLDEPNLPPDRLQELVRIEADPSSRFGIIFSEV
jgi:hypothetical protein